MTTPHDPQPGDEEPLTPPLSEEPAAVRDSAPVAPAPAQPVIPPGGQAPYPPYVYPQTGDYQPPYRPGPQVLSIISFVCAAVSLIFCPYLFGPAGIILGIVGHNKGESLGKWAAITSAVAMIVGLVAAFVIFSGDIIPDQG